jgi:hypothetical protein
MLLGVTNIVHIHIINIMYYLSIYLFLGETLVHFKVNIFWDTRIAPCGTYVNRRFRGMYHLHLQGRKSAEQEISVQQVASLDGDDIFL